MFKLLNLYPGEGRSVLLFAFLAFLWSFGTYAAVTLGDGFFLQKMGASLLPEAYFLTAISLFAVTSLFLWAFNHFDAYHIYRIVLMTVITATTLLALYVTFFDPFPAFWFCLKVFSNTFTVALTTCFWFFIDQYFNTQNAKRLYTIFSSAIFLGNGLGSLFIASFINSFQEGGVLAVLAIVFCLTLLAVRYISGRMTPVFDDLTESSYTPERQPFKRVLKGFIHSRFTQLLIGTYLLIQILYIVTELSYLKGFETYFQGIEAEGSNDLIILLGTCTAWLSLANIIFGLFFYSRMVSRIGVNTATLISPLFFLAAFIGLGLVPGLLITIFSLVVVEGVSYVIDENNSNLLLNTVPFALKNKARVAIDSFFEPLGMLISALAFLVLPFNTQSFGLILTMLCLAFALMLRHEYRAAVWDNLSSMALSFQKSLSGWIKLFSAKERRKVTQDLLAKLRCMDEPSQLITLELLLYFDDATILPKLLFQASRFSLKGRVKVVQLFEKSRYCKHPEVIDRLQVWLREMPGSYLQKQIQLYLARLGLLHPDQISTPATDIMSRKARILALKSSWAHLTPETIGQNHAQAQEELELLLSSSESAELAAGIDLLSYEKTSSNLSRVLPYLHHSDDLVVVQAARSLESLIEPSDSCHAPYIIHCLPYCCFSEARLACLNALNKIANSTLINILIPASLHFRPAEKRLVEALVVRIGETAVAPLGALLHDDTLHDRSRLLAGRILYKIAHDFPDMTELLTKELKRAYFYFYHAHTEGVIIPEIIRAEYLSATDLIVQLIGLGGGFEESDLLSRALQSKNPKTRGTALETVEKTCPKKLWQLLKPLIDERPLSDKMRFASRFIDDTLLIEALQKSASHTTQLTVMTLKASLNFPGWKETADLQRAGKSGLYYQFATELIGG